MLSKILSKLNRLSHSRLYWSLLILASISLLVVALMYQYLLDELPCVLCIQVRLWVSLLAIISTIGFFTCQTRGFNIVSNVAVVAVAAALAERSYQLLGTERGFIFGDCGFSAGLPQWFAIEDWLPWLYRIETSCGYTPELILGITMAEALMFLSSVLLLVGVSISIATLYKYNVKNS